MELLEQASGLTPDSARGSGFQRGANLNQMSGSQDAGDTFERVGFGSDAGVVAFRQRGVNFFETRLRRLGEFVEQQESKVHVVQALFEKLIAIDRWREQQILEIAHGQFVRGGGRMDRAFGWDCRDGSHETSIPDLKWVRDSNVVFRRSLRR